MLKALGRLSKIHKTQIVLFAISLISGVDDLIEAWIGMKDIFGLDAAHGVVLMAVANVLDPVAKLIEQASRRSE